MNEILNIIAGVGLTFIVTQSKLFCRLQKYYLFSCTMCFGFWAGCLISLPSLNIFVVINNGLAVSLFSYLVWLLVKDKMNKHDR